MFRFIKAELNGSREAEGKRFQHSKRINFPNNNCVSQNAHFEPRVDTEPRNSN